MSKNEILSNEEMKLPENFEILRQNRWVIYGFDKNYGKIENLKTIGFRRFKIVSNEFEYFFDFSYSSLVEELPPPKIFKNVKMFKIEFLDSTGKITDEIYFKSKFKQLELNCDYSSAEPLNYIVSYQIEEFLSSKN